MRTAAPSELRQTDRDLVYPVTGALLQCGAYDRNGQSPGGRRCADERFIQAHTGHSQNMPMSGCF
ncbi:MAG: hypothetical protein ACLQVK_00440 [Acidimicrobiales bacterium]